MTEKRITIRVPFDTWKSLRELQTEGKVASIQQAAVAGMNQLIAVLKDGGEPPVSDTEEAAKQRVLDLLVREKPLGSWDDLHRERTEADAGRS